MPGHRLILRPISKPGGALPACYTHCCVCACPCSACSGFCSLHDRCCRRRHQHHGRIQERSGPEMYTVPCATSSLLPRRRATSSRRVGFGRCSPSTTSTTPRTSPFPNPRGPLVSVSSNSRRICELLPQLHVCAFRLVTMVRIWCTRSLGRLNLLDILLRHNALVGGHPGPRKKADEHSSTR